MENLENYDGFWRDLVSKGSQSEKVKYLIDLIRNQTEQLKRKGRADDKEFHKNIIKLAKEEKSKIT